MSDAELLLVLFWRCVSSQTTFLCSPSSYSGHQFFCTCCCHIVHVQFILNRSQRPLTFIIKLLLQQIVLNVFCTFHHAQECLLIYANKFELLMQPLCDLMTLQLENGFFTRPPHFIISLSSIWTARSPLLNVMTI